MKFEREETPTVMDGIVIRWRAIVGWHDIPEISASRNGVLISGSWPVLEGKGIEAVKAQLDEAHAKYQELKVQR